MTREIRQARWTNALAVGDDGLDSQHQVLFATLNSLYGLIEAARGQPGRETLRDTADRLEAYALTHFLAEEAFMKKVGFPDLEAHRAMHATFRAKVSDLRTELANGAPNPEHLVEFIEGWLVDHILDEDTRYAAWAARGTR